MRKANMKTLASVFIIASMMFSIGLGTMAYFNEVVQATGNTFTAGYLDVKISTDNINWFDTLSDIWDSPSNWAPGETFDGAVYFKNFGNVPVQVVLVNLKDYATNKANFWDVIEVVQYTEYALPTTNYAPFMDDSGWLGNGDGVLTLHELMDTPNTPGVGDVGDCDNILFMDPGLPPHAEECDANAKNLLGNTYLGPEETGWLYMKFKFSSTAGIEYQNAECSFNLQLSFIQGPDSGICRHELPGFISP